MIIVVSGESGRSACGGGRGGRVSRDLTCFNLPHPAVETLGAEHEENMFLHRYRRVATDLDDAVFAAECVVHRDASQIKSGNKRSWLPCTVDGANPTQPTGGLKGRVRDCERQNRLKEPFARTHVSYRRLCCNALTIMLSRIRRCHRSAKNHNQVVI